MLLPNDTFIGEHDYTCSCLFCIDEKQSLYQCMMLLGVSQTSNGLDKPAQCMTSTQQDSREYNDTINCLFMAHSIKKIIQ